MKQNKASLTAAGTAVTRAIESARPEDERVCYDPYARLFAGSALYYLTKFFVDTGYSEWRGPGVMGFLVSRARYLDDTLQSCLNAGLEQLVILGAGYDSRAYRFEGLRRGVHVFEVDHPATQAVKLEKLKHVLGHVPDYVTYVPIDFTQATLEQRLCTSGYDDRRKTLFTWEGVTHYLTPSAVDDTLAFVVNHSGAGSSIVFDYMYTSLLDGTVRHGEVSGMRRYRGLTGEELVFGIPEGTIDEFLRQRGFDQVVNVDQDYFKRTYFMTPRNQKRKVAAGYAIATGIVA